MRLTNYLRDAFIRAAMDDVPKIDYDEQMRKLVLDDAIAQLPAKVRAVYLDKSTTGFVNTTWAHKYGGISVPCHDDDGFKISDVSRIKWEALKKSNEQQTAQRHELETKLKACAYACTTREALFKMLPEFEKYMPATEEKAIRTLPVVANVVSDFVKAGWPKTVSKNSKKAA